MGQSVRTKMRTVIFPGDAFKGSRGLPTRVRADCGSADIEETNGKPTNRTLIASEIRERRVIAERMTDAVFPSGKDFILHSRRLGKNRDERSPQKTCSFS